MKLLTHHNASCLVGDRALTCTPCRSINTVVHSNKQRKHNNTALMNKSSFISVLLGVAVHCNPRLSKCVSISTMPEWLLLY
jgi:hypothetical protein